MTLEEAIKKYESDAMSYQMSADIDKANALQLAHWLRELKGYRSEEAYMADMSMQEWLDKRGDV